MVVINKLVNLIIRPHRCEYQPSALGLLAFMLDDLQVNRQDLVLVNGKGLRLRCTHFQPDPRHRRCKLMPCVIYCHGNCGSRADAFEVVNLLLPYGISVFALDFSGSGHSDGKYVSLGAHESLDVGVVVSYLRHIGTVSRIGLWGRSMGAATALLYSSTDPSIAAVLADSPFASLLDLIPEIVRSKANVPKSIMNVALKVVQGSVKRRAKFDIAQVNVLNAVQTCYCPALIAHGDSDMFIGMHHSKRIVDAYAGDCNFVRFEGDHNSKRPSFLFDSAAIFFYNTLFVPVHSDLKTSSSNSYNTPLKTINTSRQYHGVVNNECTIFTPSKRPGAIALLSPSVEFTPRRLTNRMVAPANHSTDGDKNKDITNDRLDSMEFPPSSPQIIFTDSDLLQTTEVLNKSNNNPQSYLTHAPFILSCAGLPGMVPESVSDIENVNPSEPSCKSPFAEAPLTREMEDVQTMEALCLSIKTLVADEHQKKEYEEELRVINQKLRELAVSRVSSEGKRVSGEGKRVSGGFRSSEKQSSLIRSDRKSII